MKKAYLLTGEPGCGKTTIIKETLARANKSAGGFYTEEIRNQGNRQGFKIVTLDGKSAVLSHIDMSSPHKVSKYGVDTDNIDKVAVPAIEEAIRIKDVIVIDEIGKMELFSQSFQDAVLRALSSEKKTLGTIMLASHPWADKIKQRPDVEIVKMTRSNRSEVLSKVLDWLRV
ncbi:MAG: NTPase [Chloroflexi bacterium]|nr:NTPase [Chloroflexota bacterium]